MPEIIKYKVVRLPGPENNLEQQLEDQGAGLWELCGILHSPLPGARPYLCIFKRKEQA